MRQGGEGGERRPLAILLKGEKAAHAWLGNHPLQATVAVEVCQGLPQRAVAVRHGDACQRLQRAIGHMFGGCRWRPPERFTVVPRLVATVKHPWQTVAVQVNQLVALAVVGPVQGIKWLIPRAVGSQLKTAVGQLQGGPVVDCSRRVHCLLMHGLQQAGASAGGGVLQQHASGKHRGGAEAGLFGEVVEHQDLPAQPPSAQFKTAGIAAERVAAHRPGLLFGVTGRLVRGRGAFAVVQEQLKMPLPGGRCAVGPECQLRPGRDVAIAYTAQVTLGAVVMGAIAAGIGLVAIEDLLPEGVQAFFEQPLRNMGGGLRIGDACRSGFAKQMDVAIRALNKPEPCRVCRRGPVFDAVEAGFSAWQITHHIVVRAQCQAVELVHAAAFQGPAGRPLGHQFHARRADKAVFMVPGGHAPEGAAQDGTGTRRPACAERAVAQRAVIVEVNGRGEPAPGGQWQGNLQRRRTGHPDGAPAVADTVDGTPALGQGRSLHLIIGRCLSAHFGSPVLCAV